MKIPRLLRIKRITCYGTFGASLSVERIMELVGVTRRTAQRWIKDPAIVPKAEQELLEIKALGLLQDPEFEGWCVAGGKLVSPTDRRLTASEIDGFSLMCQRSRWQELVIKRLEQENEDLRQQNLKLRERLGIPIAANDER